MKQRGYCKDVLFGVAFGDAIGVPVEFRSRSELLANPVTGIRGWGSHAQPEGTWSDDSSLTFCLAEMLCTGYDLGDLARRFVNWKEMNYWTPHGEVFDIGIATSTAIDRLASGVEPVLAGGVDEGSNGNGSLMRILPLILYIRGKPIEERWMRVREVSSLTHRHTRSVITCFIYLEFALELLSGKLKEDAYRVARQRTKDFLLEREYWDEREMHVFLGVLSGEILERDETQVNSSGYVIHTLEAAIWCFMNTNNYEDAILKAVNLGQDTDTTGAVTGGLAAVAYGWDSIPCDWLQTLAKRKDIEALAARLSAKIN